jgi:hypothetical protein
MITTLIILGILTVFIIGFVQVYNRHSRVVKKIDFVGEYRNKFVDFAINIFKRMTVTVVQEILMVNYTFG